MKTSCWEQIAVPNEPPSQIPKTMRLRNLAGVPAAPHTRHTWWRRDAEWNRGTAKKHHGGRRGAACSSGFELQRQRRRDGLRETDEGKHEDKSVPLHLCSLYPLPLPGI